MSTERDGRNIFLFYIFRILNLPFFWLPILYIYLTQVKGFSVVQTTFLLSLQELLMIFLEIPTGVVADKVSRKFSVALGYVIQALPFAFFPIVFRMEGAILLFVIKAVGKALVSGADSSLLYDTLTDAGRQKEYKQIVTRANAWMMAVAAVAMAGGGYLGQLGYFNWAFYLPVPFQLVGAMAAILMYEPDISRKAKELQEKNYLKHVWQATKSVLSNRKIWIYVLLFSIFEGTAINLKWYYPAMFEGMGFTLLATGGVMSVLYFAKSLLGLLGTRFIRESALENVVNWTRMVVLAWLALALFQIWPVVIVGLMLAGMGAELLCSSSEELLHDSMDSQTRATSMSFVNLISSVVATVLLWSWGAVVSRGGVTTALWLQVAIFALAALSITLKYWQVGPNSGRVGRHESDQTERQN